MSMLKLSWIGAAVVCFGMGSLMSAWADEGARQAGADMPDGNNSFVPRNQEPSEEETQAAMQNLNQRLNDMREPGDIARARREEANAKKKRQQSRAQAKSKAANLPGHQKKPARPAEDLEAQNMDDVLRAYQAAPERFDSDFEGEAYELQNGDSTTTPNQQ